MTHSRLDLHKLLKETIGSENVYFQPPASLLMSYPCIRYELSGHDVIFADDAPYVVNREYQLILIDSNPDTELVDKLAMLPLCKLNRFYASDNLNHYVFIIYY